MSQPLTPTPEKNCQPEVCPDCGGTGFVRDDVPHNHPNFGKLFRCEHPIHQPERIARLAQVSGLHPADLERRLRDIKPSAGNQAMINAVRELVKDPFGWLYIWGGPGNAKSEILIAVVNELNLSNRGPAVYTKFSQIIQYMRDAFAERKQRDKHGLDSPDMGYIARFEKLKAIKVLAIDEMDKARSTPFAEEFRFDFLDERYRQAIRGETVTLFAGQINPQDLDGENNLPLYDRFRDGRFKIVHNTAGSARPHMRRDSAKP